MADERFVRWQGYSIGQLTFALNMFFGLAVGSLAFAFSLVRDDTFILCSWPKLAFQITLVSLSIAVIVSCGAVVSRLMDFRFTAKKIRADAKEEDAKEEDAKEEDAKEEVEESALYKYRSSWLGRLTWRLLWIQLGTLVIGLMCLILAVLSGYSHRIW